MQTTEGRTMSDQIEAVVADVSEKRKMVDAAEAATRKALDWVILDAPGDAREIIARLPFKQRALLVAWAEELSRIGREEMGRYERRERLSNPDPETEGQLV